MPLSNTIIASFRKEYKILISVLSESIPALGWVTVSPAPAPFVLEMFNAGQFYTNRFLSIRSNKMFKSLTKWMMSCGRVLKDFKGKAAIHVEWVKAWGQCLAELQVQPTRRMMMMTIMVNVVMVLMIS